MVAGFGCVKGRDRLDEGQAGEAFAQQTAVADFAFIKAAVNGNCIEYSDITSVFAEQAQHLPRGQKTLDGGGFYPGTPVKYLVHRRRSNGRMQINIANAGLFLGVALAPMAPLKQHLHPDLARYY